jgi:hypothetical protein
MAVPTGRAGELQPEPILQSLESARAGAMGAVRLAGFANPHPSITATTTIITIIIIIIINITIELN